MTIENAAPEAAPKPAPAPVVPAPAAPDLTAVIADLSKKLDSVLVDNAALKTKIDSFAQDGLTPFKTKYPDVTPDMLADVPAEKREALAIKLQTSINGHKPKTAQDPLTAWAHAGNVTPATEDEARQHEQKRSDRIEKAKSEGNLDAVVSERKPEYAKFLSNLLRKPGR